MRRKLMMLLLPALLALGACSSSDDTESVSTSQSAATTVAATTAAAVATEAPEPFKLGLILVGPRDDRGYSQAHFEGGTYAVEKLGGELIVVDKVNPADSPNITIPQIVDDMIAQGVHLIIATSDDMKDGILEAAAAHPDVPMIHASGDSAWADGKAYHAELPMLGNFFGQMEYGKMIAGCAAALQSDAGKISYLGPLINDETRRLVSSTYLGARHCWTEVLGKSASDLSFNVNWIGFWFNIPGFTLDPTVVANEFFASGTDVIISGIDTTEAIVEAGKKASAGDTVWAIPYDYEGACAEAPTACLGVPYFNWGPTYLKNAQSVIDGKFTASFAWIGPDWSDINNHDTSTIGFLKGDGLTSANAEKLDDFIASLGDGSLNLWTGPLNFQDGSSFLDSDVAATDLEIWYMPSLLEGMVGPAE